MNYWLMKSEPEAFSIDDLKNRPQQIEHWDGVRNYQARNFMRAMKKQDKAFFYHSSCEVPGIVGIVTIVKEAYPDFTAWDLQSDHYDPKSTPQNPRWFMVDVKYQRKLKRTISLAEMREQAALQDFPLLRKGNRLSVLPLNVSEWQSILALE